MGGRGSDSGYGGSDGGSGGGGHSQEVTDFANEWDVDLSSNYVSWEMANGHEHTMKAFNEVQETPYFEGNKWDQQMEYIHMIEQNENTYLEDVKTANTKEEAIEKEIIDEDGGVL